MQRLVIALVTVLGLTAGSVVAGYFLLSGVTDRAAAIAPARTAVYLNVYLQPSTGQQMNLAGLIGKLPGFADDASLDAKIDEIVGNLLDDAGIDYATQVKPWLGDQIAVAGWPVGQDGLEAESVVIADVKDPAAAETSVPELVADGAADFSARTYSGVELHVAEAATYAFLDDLLLIGPTPDALEAAIDVANGGESLADQAAFRDAMGRVPSDHVASAFVDLGALAAAGGVDGLGSFTTASAALVAERDGLRLSGSAPFDLEAAAPSARDSFAMGTEPSSLSAWMPDETVASVVVFGLRQVIEDAEVVAGGTGEGEEMLGLLDTIRAIAAFGLGIDLDADVLPLLDREVGLAITGFDGALPSGQLLLRPNDPEAAAAALGTLAERLTTIGGSSRTEDRDGLELTLLSVPDIGEVAYTIVDGIIIIGLSADDVVEAVQAHASGDALSSTDAYRRAFEVAGGRAGTEAFVDLHRLIELGVLDATTAELPSDARDILDALEALALTLPSRGDQIDFHAVLTVSQPSAD